MVYDFTTIAGTPLVPGSLDGTNTHAQFNRPLADNGLWIRGLTASGGKLYATMGNAIIKLSRNGTNWATSLVAGQCLVGGCTAH